MISLKTDLTKAPFSPAQPDQTTAAAVLVDAGRLPRAKGAQPGSSQVYLRARNADGSLALVSAMLSDLQSLVMAFTSAESSDPR